MNISRGFLGIGSLYLIIGIGLGSYMGGSGDHTLAFYNSQAVDLMAAGAAPGFLGGGRQGNLGHARALAPERPPV